MSDYARQQNTLSINCIKPATWGHLLHPEGVQSPIITRLALIQELKRYYGVMQRDDLRMPYGYYDDLMATIFETLVHWITWSQSIKLWEAPENLRIAEELILQLCAHRVSSGHKDDKKRREARNGVFVAASKSTASKDVLQELMLRPPGVEN